MAAIYSTLGKAQTLAGPLRDRGLLSDAIWLGFFLIVAAILTPSLNPRPRGTEMGPILVFAYCFEPEIKSYLNQRAF